MKRRNVAKTSWTRASGEKRLIATPISVDGATTQERRANVFQLTGSSLRMPRSVPERAVNTVMIRLAPTASLMSHPAT
jgi:hypothetical protein